MKLKKNKKLVVKNGARLRKNFICIVLSEFLSVFTYRIRKCTKVIFYRRQRSALENKNRERCFGNDVYQQTWGSQLCRKSCHVLRGRPYYPNRSSECRWQFLCHLALWSRLVSIYGENKSY